MAMFGLGTLINCAAIVAGGIIGRCFGNLLSKRIQEVMVQAIGLVTIYIGISGAISAERTVAEQTTGLLATMMIITSMMAGAFTGELLKMEDRLASFGVWLKQKSGSTGDGEFVSAFVTSSLIVCIGAMAVIGSIQDGIAADFSVLAAKSTLDFVMIMILAASLGRGAVFSAVPVLLFQGSVTLIAHYCGDMLSVLQLANISSVGNIMIAGVGVNILRPNTFRVMNFLPGLAYAVIWGAVL